MKRRTVVALFVLALSPLLAEVRGDLLPGPGVRPGVRPPVNPFAQPGAGRPLPVKVKLVVQVSDRLKVPVLQVPVNLALGQQARPGVGQAPDAEPDSGRRFGLTTVVAGLALTLAFASGGLWLVRRGSTRTLVILGVVSLVAVCTAAVWANGVPPPGFRRPPAAPIKPALVPLKLPAGIELNNQLILEPMPPGDHLTLIVPKSMVMEKEKEAAPRAKPIR